MERQAEGALREKMGHVLSTTGTQMSLFKHVSKRDFTTCPSFGLHPVLHSFILSTLVLFSLTAWLPFLAVCLVLLLLLWLLLAPNCALFTLSTFLFFFLVIFLSIQR